MAIENLLSFIYLCHPNVVWQQHNKKRIGEVAREKILNYFTTAPSYNTPSVFVSYQLKPQERSLWDKISKRHRIIEDWIFKKEESFSITPFGRDDKTLTSLDNYLEKAQCVYLGFLFGTHDLGNLILDQNLTTTRIGIIPKINSLKY